MKYKFKKAFDSAKFAEVFKKPFFFVANLIKNVRRSYSLMSRLERMIALLLLLIAFGLGSYKIVNVYINRTKLVAASGGDYREAVVGDIKYLNPVLAQSDSEKAATRLMFSSLVQVNGNQIVPDVADHYDISSTGTDYAFYLKKNIKFSNGEPLTSADVNYTVSMIQNPATKSPLFKAWSGVTVSVVDDYTITFTLPKAYGPFIYNCSFGILPSNIPAPDFSKKFIGSGPYSYVKSIDKNGKIAELDLTRNEGYYGVKSYMNTVRLDFFSDKDPAATEYEKNTDVQALFGSSSSVGTKLDYVSAKEFALIFNLRLDSLKDKAVRDKITAGAIFDTTMNFQLTVLDGTSTQSKAGEIKNSLKAQNINVTIRVLNPVQFQDALTNHDYELLLYGFDFGYDRDPYPYWHSSQLSALNLAGWSDKASDILLEDARMLTDPVARNAKYDQFFNIVKANSLAIFYSPIQYNFTVKDALHGASAILGNQANSRYSNISSWYLQEKRVGK